MGSKVNLLFFAEIVNKVLRIDADKSAIIKGLPNKRIICLKIQ